WETLMFTLPERERGASITESCDGMGPVAGKVPNEPAGNVTRIGVSVVPARPWNSRLGKRRALAAPIFCSARSTDRAALATLRFWRKARATASSRVSTSGPAPTVSADAVALTANARTVQNDIARIAFPFPRPEVAARHPFPRRVPTAACDDNSPRMLDLPVRTREDGSPRATGPGGSGTPLLAETRQWAWRPALECGAMPRPPEQGAEALQTALSSVARAIADSLELKEVWDRVAEACRAIVPFDGMGVSRLQPGDVVRVVAVT